MLDPTALILVIAAGLATTLGAIPVFFIKEITHKFYDSMLGFAAGLMLAVTALNLIPAALGPDKGNIIQTVTGISLGVITLFIIEAKIHHVHRILELKSSRSVKTSLMIVFAIVIHNFPEGFATGSVYSGGVNFFSNTVALAIAIQNIPEGLAVAFPLLAIGYSTKRSFGAGVLSGVVEPICAVGALVLVGFFDALLPYALAFAGGAMLFVIFDEMVPESHSHGFERHATSSFVVGFLLMLLLNYIGARMFV